MAWYRCLGSEKVRLLCSTGTQQIVLPVKASEQLVFKFDLYTYMGYNQGGGGDYCFLADIWSGGGWLVHTRSQWEFAFRYDNSSGSHIYPITPFVKKSIEVNTIDGGLKIDGVTKSSGHTVSYTSGANINMFGMSSGYGSIVSVSDMKIYKDGSLYMNMIPMKDTETDAGYYYDTIGGQSYYSLRDPLIYAEI